MPREDINVEEWQKDMIRSRRRMWRWIVWAPVLLFAAFVVQRIFTQDV